MIDTGQASFTRIDTGMQGVYYVPVAPRGYIMPLLFTAIFKLHSGVFWGGCRPPDGRATSFSDTFLLLEYISDFCLGATGLGGIPSF